MVPLQKFVNIFIRNSENVQICEDLQILLATSSGLLGISWPCDLWFDSWFDDVSYVLCLLIDSNQCLPRISRGWSSNGFTFGHSHKLPGITTGFAFEYLS